MKLPNQLSRVVGAAALCTFAFTFLHTTELSAQFTSEGMPSVARYAGLMGNQANSPKDMHDAMSLYAENLQYSLELSDQQINKLNLAAKLVSEKVFVREPETRRVPFKKQELAKDNKDSFSDQDSESKAGKSKAPEKRLKPKKPVAISAGLEHPTWVKALDSVLSDEQKTKLESLQEKQRKAQRAAAIEFRVYGLLQTLRLRDDQIAAVTEIVDRVEGDELTDMLREGGIKPGRVIIVDGGGYDSTRSLSAADLKDVLTEKQLNQFNKVVEGYRARAGRRRSSRPRPQVQPGTKQKPKPGVKQMPKSGVKEKLKSDAKQKVDGKTKKLEEAGK